MAIYFTSLNSGSNGNCYYVGTKTDAVLIDAGLSCRETEKRMNKLGLNMTTVKALFISHEHGDHIKGVTTLANKYNLPVYITDKTAKNGPRLISHLSKSFCADQPVHIGDLAVTAFSKNHDAADPHSFIISYRDLTLGVFTDIGSICETVIRYFKQCQAVFLEANYDDDMLTNGKYPMHLKSRIRGGWGHLSNKEALDLFIQHRSPALSQLLLSHLSKENNSPEMAETLFKQYATGVNISVASRYMATQVFMLTANSGNSITSTEKSVSYQQLNLFE